MAKTRSSGIPPVPLRVDPSLRQFLEALRENLEVTVGRRGLAIDRAVTFRDLQNSTLAELGISANNSGSNGEDLGEVALPMVPTNFSGVAGFDFVLLSWDIPSYSGHAFAEIYRQTVVEPDPMENPPPPEQVISVANASLVGTTPLFLFRDTVVSGSKHYYWIRFVNLNDEPGPYHSTDGLYLEVAVSYDSLIDESIVDILAGLAIWQGDIITSLDLLNDAVIKSTLENATAISEVGTSVVAAEGRLNSSITTNQLAAASETQTIALQTENLQSTIYNVNPDGSIQLNEFGEPVLTGAFIDKVDSTLATLDGELKASISNTVSLTDANGNTYSLSDLLQLALDAEGNFTAQWGIKFSKNDLLYGVGLVSTNNVVTFTVAADSFAIYNPANGLETIPFVVNAQGQVLISQAFIDYAAITTLVSENIVASKIAAGVSITSPIITGGQIIGGSLNINDTTRIESNGLLTTQNAFIQGHIDADSGTLNNVTIENTCTVNGTINAVNIEGDVLDRSVAIIGSSAEFQGPINMDLVSGTIVPGFIGATTSRLLVISGLSILASRFALVLYRNGVEVQRVQESAGIEYEINNLETILLPRNISPVFACQITPSATPVTYALKLELLSVTDSLSVNAGAIITDVFKNGSTITGVSSAF